jgi:hypothetical protein
MESLGIGREVFRLVFVVFHLRLVVFLGYDDTLA